MAKDTPIACSLSTGALKRRLDDIAEIGADSLISRDVDGNRQLLRFRASPTARRRLESIIAAEAECCAFLDLSLSEEASELVLSVTAPEDAQSVAEEFVSAFSKVTA